jgi:hypothetical protein
VILNQEIGRIRQKEELRKKQEEEEDARRKEEEKRIREVFQLLNLQ